MWVRLSLCLISVSTALSLFLSLSLCLSLSLSYLQGSCALSGEGERPLEGGRGMNRWRTVGMRLVPREALSPPRSCACISAGRSYSFVYCKLITSLQRVSCAFVGKRFIQQSYNRSDPSSPSRRPPPVTHPALSLVTLPPPGRGKVTSDRHLSKQVSAHRL